MVEKKIEIRLEAEDEQIIKDVFKRLADQLNQDYQLDKYEIKYKEESEMAVVKPMDLKINYEGAWKELREHLGLMDARSLYSTLLLYMDELEVKHKNMITIKERTDKEIVEHCIRSSVEAGMENIHLKKRIKELEKNEKLYNVYIMIRLLKNGYSSCIKRMMSAKELSFYEDAFRSGKYIKHEGERARITEMNISCPARDKEKGE